jgi:hypothetical protein
MLTLRYQLSKSDEDKEWMMIQNHKRVHRMMGVNKGVEMQRQKRHHKRIRIVIKLLRSMDGDDADGSLYEYHELMQRHYEMPIKR